MKDSLALVYLHNQAQLDMVTDAITRERECFSHV